MPKFDEDAAIEVAYESEEVVKFEEANPECVFDVGKMSPKETEAWIKKHPKADVGSPPPKNLWVVELVELGKEKIVVTISPETKKIVEIKKEEAEKFPEEE